MVVWLLSTTTHAAAGERSGKKSVGAKDSSKNRTSDKRAGAKERIAPAVGSARVIVVDAETERILFAKNHDNVAAIASTTKIFVGMAVRQREIDLDGATKITKIDRNFARGGARTRLDVHRSFKNHDLLRAMLVSSDNRAPTALGRAAGMAPKQLIATMNHLARDLGLKKTKFTDPSGLRGNVSTAREMAIAFKAALSDPVLSQVMGTRTVDVRSIDRKSRNIHYRNTNRPLHNKGYKVIGGKTGFTRKAGYCLLIAATIKGRDVLMVFLGAKSKQARFRDFYRVARWLKAGHAPALKAASRLTDIAS